MSWADELNPELQKSKNVENKNKVEQFNYNLTQGSGKVIISNKQILRADAKKTVTMHLSKDLVDELQKQPASRTLSIEALLRFALHYLQSNNYNLEI